MHTPSLNPLMLAAAAVLARLDAVDAAGADADTAWTIAGADAAGVGVGRG